MAISPTVIQAMTPFPVTVQQSATCLAARAIMAGHEIHHLPVLDRDDRVVAVVTLADLDLAKALLGDEDVPVSKVCVREPVRIEHDESLKAAVRKISRAGADAGVVERRGRLAGIITLSDIGDVLLGLLPGPFFDKGGDVA
jgi:CBS domain-containing membrane protein